MMFCKNCGCKLPEDAKFCVKCGTSVESTAASTGKNVETSTPSSATDSQTVHNRAVAKKQRLPWIIVVILVVLVGILAVALGTTKMGNQNTIEPNDKKIAEVRNFHETTTTDLTTTATTKATTTATTTVTTTTTIATTAKPVVTTTAKPKPYVTASAKTFLLSGYDGSKVRL